MDLSGVFRALKSGTLLEYEQALAAFGIRGMPPDNADRLLLDLLDVCRERGNADKALASIAAWQTAFWDSVEYDPYSPEKGDVPLEVLLRLFSMPEASSVLRTYAAGLYADRLSPFELAHEVATGPSSPTTKQTLDAIFRTFGAPVAPETLDPGLTPLVAGDLETLRDEAYDAQNMEAYDYLDGAIRRVSQFAEKPPWVKNFSQDPEVPYVDEIVYPPVLTLREVVHLWSPERVADFMVAGKDILGIPGVSFAQQLEYFRGLKPEAYRAQVAPLVLAYKRAKLFDDLALFRIFGPANPKVNFDLALDSPCAAYGGCRMFICRCSELYDEEEEDEELPDAEGTFRDLTSWFQGSCDYCLRRIASPYYAVRLPLPLGGWQGTYCSFDHVREAIAAGFARPGYPRCQPGRCPAVTHDDPLVKIVDLVEKEVRRHGIQDRLLDYALPQETRSLPEQGPNWA